MKAFISYSTFDKDQMIITLLSNKLRNQGFQVITSQNFYGKTLDFTTKRQIDSSRIFFGIITNHGQDNERVLSEWRHSKESKVPNILLIEDNVNVNNSFKGNYIVFNRYSPQGAIEDINNKMNTESATSEKKGSNVLPWVIGGAALLGIIKLLSKDED